MAEDKIPPETQNSPSDSDESWDKNTQEEHIRRRISVRREHIRKRLAEESEQSLLLDQSEDYSSARIEKRSVTGDKKLADVIRSRVREKLKAVKGGIASSFARDLPVSSHRLQQIKDEGLVTRFDKTLKIETDEANQFFTSVLDDSSESALQEHGIAQLRDLPIEFQLTGLEEEPENEMENASRMSEEKAKFDLYINEQIIERIPAKYEHEKLQRERNINLFNPSTSEVPLTSKLPRGVAPRILKDEGFYVSQKPDVLKKIVNKMENRLLVQGKNKCWFGEDGNIIALPEPIKLPWNSRQSPPNRNADDPQPGLETVYRKAIVSELVIDIAGNFKEISQIYQLDVNIASLRFIHHPLFSREHVLAAKLMQLHDNYQQRQGKNISQLLIEKLQTLTNMIMSLEVNSINHNRIEDIKKQIGETKRLLNVEKEKDRTLLTNILNVWKQIKGLRKMEKCIHTPIKLQVQKLEVNYKSLGKQCEVEYLAEVVELEQQFEDKFNKEMEIYNEKLEIWKNKQVCICTVSCSTQMMEEGLHVEYPRNVLWYKLLMLLWYLASDANKSTPRILMPMSHAPYLPALFLIVQNLFLKLKKSNLLNVGANVPRGKLRMRVDSHEEKGIILGALLCNAIIIRQANTFLFESKGRTTFNNCWWLGRVVAAADNVTTTPKSGHRNGTTAPCSGHRRRNVAPAPNFQILQAINLLTALSVYEVFSSSNDPGVNHVSASAQDSGSDCGGLYWRTNRGDSRMRVGRPASMGLAPPLQVGTPPIVAGVVGDRLRCCAPGGDWKLLGNPSWDRRCTTGRGSTLQLGRQQPNRTGSQWPGIVEIYVGEEQKDVFGEARSIGMLGLEQQLNTSLAELMPKGIRKNLQRPKGKAKESKLIDGDESVNEYTDDDSEEPPKHSVPTDRATIENMAKIRTAVDYSQRQEPMLIPNLSQTMTVTPDLNCSGGEQRRRMEMRNHKFFISIFYNEKLVSSTITSQLQSDFTVQFQQIFNVQIIHKPENIRLEIYELINTKMNLLAKLYIPVPEVTMITSTVALEEIEFSSDEIVVTNHDGVGSNTPFLLDEGKSEECLLTSGRLLYAVSWGIDENGTALAPPAPKPKAYTESMDAIASIGMSRINDLQKLAKWAKKARIDPNDPQNLNLMHVIKYATEEDQNVPKYFRLQQMQDEFNFITDEKLEQSRRFRLLMHRNSGVPEYCCYKQVPPYEREIPEHIFEEFAIQKDDIFIIMGEDSLTEQRMMAHKYLEKVAKCGDKHYRLTKYQSQISLALFDIIAPRKTLKPMRKERKKIPAQTLSDGDIKMLINVIGAYNIPMRKCVVRAQPLFGLMSPVSGMSSNMHYRKPEGEEDPFNQVAKQCHLLKVTVGKLYKIQVQPFVEVTFQQSMYQTSIADGSQPCWNEKLEMDFRSPNGDYNSAALCKMKDKILINVFDSLTLTIPQTDCPETCRMKPHIQNWLGSISIPFSTILEQSKVSGTFRLDTPVMLLGYTWKKIDTGYCEQFYEFGLAESSLLTIFITLDPQVSCSDNEDKQPPLWQLETIEDEEILHLAYTFQKEIRNLYPKRRVVVNIIDSECRVGIVTRYIRPLSPPQELLDVFPENPEATFNLVARFVSLIPYLPDNLGFSDACNIWLTSQQFLNLILGGKEDHAVLLCNYFLYMKMNAYVLLGTSILEGPTAYVIIQEKMTTMIWNPETGDCYEQFNVFCPLQSADCLINNENVWFNIQKQSRPMSISFDTSKEHNWRPFFKSPLHNVLSSVQPPELIYYSTENALVDKLQNRIEWALKNKIMEWRVKRPTRWNRYCTGVFQNFLPLLEQNLGRSVSEEQSAGLESLLKEYKVSGFPIQMCYSKLESIFDKVYSTGIHKTDIPNVEFAVAVYIHPYPNNVLSLWIYIASLVHDF
ncbi:protein CC2D2B-like [Leucoraja erinacea]|uniref:protein CC2D2B-like n=1 Tax=Leucoraja erinaceus TaxID=7782 RepID=UPI0024564B2F|nr:protein CC2D2B-like [Leucoraja erinacea]